MSEGILVALFSHDFPAGAPGAQIDIAGTAQTATSRSVLVPGGDGLGARHLAHLPLGHTATA